MNRTLNEHSSLGQSKKVQLYLVQPTEKLSYQFAALRNELENSKIPYTSLIGLDDVKQLMNDQSHKNVIIVNNSNLNQNQLPKEIFDYHGNQIYFYPYPFQNYRFVQKPDAVVNLYRNYTDNSGNQNNIRLRSIKKDLQRQRSKEPDSPPELYKNIMIMNQRGVNPQYKKLFQVLQNYRPRVTSINRENDIMNCQLSGKSLIIVQRESYDTTNKFVNNNRLQKNIDLAILGYSKGLNKGKNFAIITDNPTQIIDFLEESGTRLNLAKQMLNKQSGSQSNFVASAQTHNQNQNTGMFILEQGKQLSFAAQDDNRNGQPTFGQRVDDGGQVVTYTDQNHIPINSRLSESSKNTTPKKVIKKVKGNEKNQTNISEASVMASSVDKAPIINIKGINQISSNQQIDRENIISEKNLGSNKKKSIMHWQLYPNFDQKNSSGKVPGFTLLQKNQATAGNNNVAQNQNNPIAINKINQSLKNINPKKREMHWYISPENNNMSSKPKFIQLNQEQFNSQGRAVPPLPSISNSVSRQSVTNIQRQNSQPVIIEQDKKINENYSLNRSPPTIVVNRVEQPNQVRDDSNRYSVKPVVAQNSAYTSRKSIQSESGPRSLSSDSLKYDRTQKLEEKYATSHRITELSQQNRASTISFPNQDQTSKRYVISSNNSYTAFAQPNNNNLDMKRTSSGTEKETRYWSQKLQPEIKRAQFENRSSIPTISNFNTPVTTSYDRPPRIVRNEPQSVDNHYQKQSNKTIESSKQLVQVTPYKSPQPITSPVIVKPIQTKPEVIGNNIASNPVINNPAYTSINATLVNNFGSKTYTNPETQRGLINIPASAVMGKSYEQITRRNSIQAAQVNRSTNNIIGNNSYTSNYANYSTSVGKPALNTISTEPKKESLSGYTPTLGIDTSKYDIVTDDQGRTVYKLKQSFFNNPTPPKQKIVVERYQSQSITKSNPVYQQPKTIISPRTSINSPRALQNHTYVRPQQSLNKYATSSYSSTTYGDNINNKTITQSPISRQSQEVKQVITAAATTTTTTNYGLNKTPAPLQSASSTSRGVFNWDDYEEHTDNAGRKYYKIRAKPTSPAPAYQQTPVPISPQIAVTNTPISGTNPTISPSFSTSNVTSARVTSNENILTPRTVASPYKADTYNVGSPRSSAYSQQLMLESKNQSYTPPSQNLLIESRFGDSNNNYKSVSNGYSESASRYTLDKQSLNSSTNSRQINQATYQNGITRTVTSPTAAVQQTLTKEQTPYGHRETYAFEKIERTVKNQQPDYMRSTAQQVTYNNRSNQFNTLQQTSGLSRDSQFTDKSSSMYKALQPLMYNDQRVQNNNFRAGDEDQLHRLKEEYKSLKTKNNYTHYIIDTSHPLWLQIEKLPIEQDKVAEINELDKIYDFMLDRSLPNDYYDIGFIFLNSDDFDKVLPSSLVDGYYLVDVDPSNPPLDIKKDRKQIKISDLRNLSLAKKVLLAPKIQHYLFHPRNSDSETSKMLNMFPSTKFQKISYSNRGDLQNQLAACSKNNARLSRYLIITNPFNISEIAPVLQSAYNQKNFTMICTSKDHMDQRLRGQYKKVLFPNEFDFNSYGSVMAAASFGDRSQINVGQPYEADFVNTGYQNNGDLNRAYNIETYQKGSLPKIFIQHPHKNIDKQIERAYPGKFNFSYFTRASEIKDRSHDNWIILHREADNIGEQFGREIGTSIVLGGRNGDRIPGRSIKLGTVDELIEILQS